MSDFDPSAMIGEVLGGYRLDSLIGRGGMGAVFAVTHLILGRPAAMKILSSTFAKDRSFVGRFLREARVVNAIRHPNIIDIYDVIETADPPRLALVMERIDGPTLGRLLASGPLLPETVRELMGQLVDALTAVHALGVVHRDLKPDNIMLLGSNGAANLARPLSIKVLDFGVAKVDDDDPALTTVSGAFIGTPAYMAPEQIHDGHGTAASDVYALGELLYEMITGRRLFSGEPRTVLRDKLVGEIPPIALTNPAIAHLIRRCVAPEPADRPRLEEIAHSLDDLVPWRSAASATGAAPSATIELSNALLDLSHAAQRLSHRWLGMVLLIAAALVLMTALFLLSLQDVTQPRVTILNEPPASVPETRHALASAPALSTRTATAATAATESASPPRPAAPPVRRPRLRPKRPSGAGTATSTPFSKDRLAPW